MAAKHNAYTHVPEDRSPDIAGRVGGLSKALGGLWGRLSIKCLVTEEQQVDGPNAAAGQGLRRTEVWVRERVISDTLSCLAHTASSSDRTLWNESSHFLISRRSCLPRLGLRC